MSAAYEELRARALRRWKELIAGPLPWIRVGGGVSGESAGADAVTAAIVRALDGIGKRANVSRVGMLGLCYAEPLVDIMLPGGHQIFYANVTPESVQEIVESHIGRGSPEARLAFAQIQAEGSSGIDGTPKLDDLPAMKRQTRVATRLCGFIDPRALLQYVANDGYAALDKALHSMTPAQALDEVKNSGLRGRGGAAFPTGVKWGFLAGSKAPVKYILCNCEEGDPGAFNDKGILEGDPHTLLEGLILAGYATGASNGVIFIRQGHSEPIENTRKAVQDAYEAGLLGKNILGSNFSYDAEVALTGDSYVAGEETALMEAIEGKRSMPRYRPPFPAQVGLWQKPSNINNVKTLAYAPQIVLKGGAWFKNIGTPSSAGTAIVCLSGDIQRPGMFEVPMGMTIREVLNEVGGGPPPGKRIKVLQTGGPLGGVLGESAFDTQIDFDAMAKTGAILGSGGIIVGSEDVSVVDLTRNLVAFNQFESCGKCFPCRLGTTHILEVLERVCQNKARAGDLELMERVGQAMKVGSLCGHGQLGYNPILSALKFFGDEFNAVMKDRKGPVGWFPDGSMIVPTRTRP
ncbi:MAG: SLBB domain-containing protein [Chloroflexi bacterium]|nr:SLBB domain-containing protein [Chloroflexota bacterium]